MLSKEWICNIALGDAMEVFNKKSRTNTVIKTSMISATCNIINTFLGFAYRTVFLHILSASYLGINGLFTNILQILSLAELGITTAITYRFYKPIKENDIEKMEAKIKENLEMMDRLIGERNVQSTDKQFDRVETV